MRYNKIRKMDISNGPGVRISIFLQGCEFNCKDCFNPETHDFKGGKEFTNESLNTLLNLDKDYIKGLSILGGEPLHKNNIKGTLEIAKAYKENFPNKTIWIWTGFTFEKLKESLDFLELLKYIDILVDGPFVEEKKDIRLKYSGSSNQRVIDIKETLKRDLKEIIQIEN